MENLEDFQLEHMMVQHLASLTKKYLILLIITNWGKNLVTKYTMVVTNECSNECNSLGITESDYE